MRKVQINVGFVFTESKMNVSEALLTVHRMFRYEPDLKLTSVSISDEGPPAIVGTSLGRIKGPEQEAPSEVDEEPSPSS